MILPENINAENAAGCSLTIRLKPDVFSYFIQDVQNRNEFILNDIQLAKEVNLSAGLKQIMYNNPFLIENYHKVNVILVSSDYELVPEEFYDKKLIKHIYQVTHSKPSYVVTCEQDLPDCKTVFGMNEDAYLYLKRSLYNPSFFHHSSLIADYFTRKAGNAKKKSMFIYYYDNLLDLICFNSNGRIIFSRTYKNEQEENLLYYILNVWEKSGFDQYKDLLYIYGYSENRELEKMLKKYIKEIKAVGLFDPISDFGEKAQTISLDLLNLLK